MADHQRMRIHPVDLEAGGRQRPTAPLVPGGSFRSDKGDPAAQMQQPAPAYPHSHLPPPPRRVAPPVPPLPPPKRRRGCCCRLICCVSAFQVDPTLTATARFDVTVTAANPNARIGIYYEAGSSLSVWYDAHRLAQGALPAFYQGHRNTTVLAVVMAGQAQLGGAVMSALQDAQRTGAVPLVFRADVPVRVELGSLKLWKVTSRVRCDLVVDSLGVNNPINIKASNCKFSLKL